MAVILWRWLVNMAFLLFRDKYSYDNSPTLEEHFRQLKMWGGSPDNFDNKDSLAEAFLAKHEEPDIIIVDELTYEIIE